MQRVCLFFIFVLFCFYTQLSKGQVIGKVAQDISAIYQLNGHTKGRFLIDQPVDEMQVQICDLLPGKRYRLWVVGPQPASFTAKLELYKAAQPTAHLPDNTPTCEWWGYYHIFYAESDCLTVTLNGQSRLLGNRPLYVSIQCTDCTAQAQAMEKGDQPELPVLSVLSQSPTYLIQDVLVGGGCFDVSAISPIGSSAGLGEFFNGLSSVGFDHGVLLETGSIFNALGPNNSNSAGNNLGSGGDPDLNILGAGPVYDAVGIEFDFTPTVDTITL